jgi:biopolymer transport protein ExbD
MAMSAGGNEGGVMAEINVTPLVDVMLVLLIIFMITAPLMSHKVKIDLPEAVAQPNEQDPRTITLAVQSSGEIYWNDEEVTREWLQSQLRVEARREPQAELQLRADKTTEYGELMKIVAVAKNSGMKKVGFITTPGAVGN